MYSQKFTLLTKRLISQVLLILFHKIDIKGVQVLIQADHVGEIWDLFFKTEKYILLDVSQNGNLSGLSMLFVGLKS